MTAPADPIAPPTTAHQNERRPIIDLFDAENPVIIVPARTGIIYHNQVDGCACVQRELEGFLIPLPTNGHEIFKPEWWERNLNRRMAGDELFWRGAMEKLLRSIDTGCNIGKLQVIDHPENSEAWVHVAFNYVYETESSAMIGVLTWQNCD